MCEVIVVTSGKGGVGKTTTTANVGSGLAQTGAKVLLIDTDIGLDCIVWLSFPNTRFFNEVQAVS